MLKLKRILLISDTHGQLDCINELVDQTKADMVIHAGDFGFYENDSVERLSNRELKLLIVHSSYKALFSKELQRDELITIVLENRLLGDFQDYRLKKRRFSVPVYTVWGNHEDIAVIERVREDNSVDNLFLLDENHCYELSSFQLCGIGGNFSTGKKLFDSPLSGSRGKVWSTLHQYGALYKNLKQTDLPLIVVSHVSPGKEPLLTRLITHFKPNFWISGHMGSPYTCVWNQFTVREKKEALEWMDQKLTSEEEVFTDEVRIALELINRPLLEEYCLKQPWNINLPDSHQGHALLMIENGRFFLETFSKGIKI